MSGIAETPPAWRQGLTFVARSAIAFVLLWAAVGKFGDLNLFAQDIDNYHLIPAALVGPLAALIPTTEVVVAFALLTGVGARGAALIAGLMLLGFTIGMGQAMARGIDLSCGCFGSSATVEVGPKAVLRNAVLVAICGFVVSQRHVGFRLFPKAKAGTP